MLTASPGESRRALLYDTNVPMQRSKIRAGITNVRCMNVHFSIFKPRLLAIIQQFYSRGYLDQTLLVTFSCGIGQPGFSLIHYIISITPHTLAIS